MSKYTKDKYMKLFVEMANKSEFNGRVLAREHRVASNIITALKDCGLISNTKTGWYKWSVDRQPIVADIKAVQKCLKTRRLASEIGMISQLQITPVKKFERTQPVPVQEEVIHDTSNSKIVLILAVGAVIGFLIATLIWK